jgi:L-seryl-tRNA(Ser) seleniumtransferase
VASTAKAVRAADTQPRERAWAVRRDRRRGARCWDGLRAIRRMCSNVAMTMPGKPALSMDQAALLRSMPSVDELLQRPPIAALCGEMNREFVVELVRDALAGLRRGVVSGDVRRQEELEVSAVEQRVVAAAEGEFESSLRPVINASGVILHTNLGRAPLAAEVIEELRRSVTRYSNLEYDLTAGARGKRDVHTSRLIERLTGAEAAIAVNNCAAAVLATLAALARGGEVIVSRGELIEIGDGFRIPEIMEQSGAVLREVGTTNRTRIGDYQNAINEQTRMLLRVHPSNFKVTGFTEKPEVAELVTLGAQKGLPVVEDLGSGCLVDLSAFGIAEPTARQSVEAGFSLVLFSGDKLLGGPQAGIIAGKKELVSKVRRHPLFRALRVDKLTITALEVTLRAYLRAETKGVPAQRMIRESVGSIEERTRKLSAVLAGEIEALDAEMEIVDGASLVGGGSTPDQSLPTKLLRIASRRYSATQLEQRLRRPASVGMPVIARIEDDRLIVDLRTVFPEQEQEEVLRQSLVAALR